jgi:hypothetical protein
MAVATNPLFVTVVIVLVSIIIVLMIMVRKMRNEIVGMEDRKESHEDLKEYAKRKK